MPYVSIFLPRQGASANWWNHRHFQHHAKPNIFHKDPDVNMLHVFVLGEWQPIEVRGRGQGSHGVFGLHRNQGRDRRVESKTDTSVSDIYRNLSWTP